MKKVLTIFISVFLLTPLHSFGYDCDQGHGPSISPTLDETSNQITNVVNKIYDEKQTLNLFKAIKEKNLKAVKTSLKLNANPNAILKDSSGLSTLSYSIKTGTPEILRAILDAGGDPNIQDDNAKMTTPLIQAARDNKPAFIDVLLDKKYPTDINKPAIGGRTPLHFAATNHSNDAIKILVSDSRIDLNAESVFVLGKGKTALSALCYYGELEGIKIMLNHPSTTKPLTSEHLQAAIATLNDSIAKDGSNIIQSYREKNKI
jgi:ankyrin repeat protein